MSLKIQHISEIDTKEMFKTSQFMLGDNNGSWFVVEGNAYLGRYIEKSEAQEHIDSLTGCMISDEEYNKLLSKALLAVEEDEIG